jgi:FKBP-type peptidyl-prolyl cis-trans isomerase FkpA
MLKQLRMGSLPVIAAVGGLMLASSCNRLGGGGGGASADPKTDDDKVFYALGLDIGKNIDVFALKPAEAELVKAGLGDAIAKRKPKVELDVVRPKIFEMARKRQEAKAGDEKKKGKDAIDKAAKEAGAQKLPSGLVIKTIRPGTGASPLETDTVKVHYEGRLTDGTVFDSSYKRNQPTEFPLKGVVRCWTEGLQKMKIGEKAQLTCPADIAYGEQGRPPTIPGGATLVFDVELLEIIAPKPATPPAPPAAPPAPGAKAPTPAAAPAAKK